MGSQAAPASGTADMLRTVARDPLAFLAYDESLHNSAFDLAKSCLDAVASGISESQQERQHALRKTRKRKRRQSESDDDEEEEQLRMKQIYTKGFALDQVWQQTRKVLGAAVEEADRELPGFLEQGGEVDEEDHDSLGEEGVDWEYDGEDVSEAEPDQIEGLENNTDDESMDDAEDGQDDESSPDIGDETPPSDLDGADENSADDLDHGHVADEYVKDPNGLNDGFFSIDDFNKQSQFLERQDASGDPNDGAASDEEDVDWTIDPLSATSHVRSAKKRQQHGNADEEDEDDEDDDEDADSPTFGNAKLDAPWSDDEDEEMDDADMQDAEDMMGIGGDFSNTNDVSYADFFAPPKVAPSNRSKAKAPLKFKAREEQEQDVADETARAISNVQKDLFDDADSLAAGSDEDEDGFDPDDPRNRNLSSHERRQLALRAEIRRLEAESLEAKPWAMTGESVAPARPQNGLLEEDLDFERAGKPVPIVTAAVNESIEELIKRRILNKDFDEVHRRRPDDLVTGPQQKRGKVELSDEKSKRGLAEEYEEDYLRKNDPNYVDTRSEALKAKHRTIEKQWAEISSQLDALSNWHYKPRAAQASLDVRVDAPTITMEDARPSAGGDAAGQSQLAPQEVYRVGEEGKREGEVVSKGGAVAAREEETQDQKKRRRRRAKERIKKAGLNKALPPSTAATDGDAAGRPKRERKADVVKQLQKGGVKVIGKKGELQDVEGKAVRDGSGGGRGAGSFRL